MITSLKDEDPETLAGLAFTTLMAKLEASDGRKKWNYLVKNLIIFDHCTEERCFLNEINELKVISIEEFIENKSKYSKFILKFNFFQVQKTCLVSNL